MTIYVPPPSCKGLGPFLFFLTVETCIQSPPEKGLAPPVEVWGQKGHVAAMDETSHTTAPQTEDPLMDLIWLDAAGADEAIGEAPVDRFAEAAAAKAARHAAILKNPAGNAPGGASFDLPPHGQTNRPPVSQAPAQKFRIPPMPAPQAAPQQARVAGPGVMANVQEAATAASRAAEAATTLDALKAAVEAFDLCPLKQTAQNTVFADGSPKPGIMLIGEAPGRDEDRIGKPFVGRAGQLLDKMLAAIGLDRTSVYITNVVNWRPPGNREPTPAEAQILQPFLRRHIELVNPAVLLTLGAVATHHVLGIQGSILRMRGQWQSYDLNGRAVPLLPFLHPAYLLRQSGQKKLAWQDLLSLEETIHTLKLLEQNKNSD